MAWTHCKHTTVIGYRTTPDSLVSMKLDEGASPAPLWPAPVFWAKSFWVPRRACAKRAHQLLKQLSAESRESQFILESLRAEGLIDFAVASGSVAEIAEHNILGATRLAMRRAIEQLAQQADGWSLPKIAPLTLFKSASEVKIIVDGRPLKPFSYAHEGVIKGDGKSLSVAMAVSLRRSLAIAKCCDS